jgi:hypothetical protein
VFPNPTNSEININLDGVKNIGETQFVLLNSFGKEMMNFSENISEGVWTKNISLNNLVSGIYILKMISNEEVQSQVIIKN